MTFKHVLLQHAEQGNTALYLTDGKNLSYEVLYEKAQSLNCVFDECKGTSSDNSAQLIFILCRQNLATIVALTAIFSGNHVAMLLPDNINEDYLKQLIKDYEPNILFDTKENTVQCVTSRQHDLHSELCLMLSTSGSTGSPKQVKLSRNNIFSNAKSIASYLGINVKERAISSLPLNYSYGLSVLTSHLFAGASVLVSDASIMTRCFWKQLTDFKITSIAGVPYTYEIFHRLKLANKELPYLKVMTQAGGRLNSDLIQYFSCYAHKADKKFYIMYGQTEATARMAYLEPRMLQKFPQSIGHAIPDGRFKIMDEQHKEIEQANTVGELVYYGPNVMMGYAQTYEDLSRGAGSDVLFTGDLAYRNHQGFYFISGRKSRFIKLFGLRVSLSDVEENLKVHNVDAVCNGQDDCLGVLVAVNNGGKNADYIKGIIRQQLNIHPEIIQLVFCQKIPLNTNNKIDYQKVALLIKEASDTGLKNG